MPSIRRMLGKTVGASGGRSQRLGFGQMQRVRGTLLISLRMTEHDGNRPQSREIRTSLVDTGWSEVPPPAEPPASDVKASAQAPETAEGPGTHEVYEPAKGRPRELPRYEVSEDDDEQDGDRAPQEDATKRIAYAALLGGSEAGTGGPTALNQEVHEQPTLVGHHRLDDATARELLLAAERAVVPEQADDRVMAPKLPAFSNPVQAGPRWDADQVSTPVAPEVAPAQSAAALAAFEAAARVFEAESQQAQSPPPAQVAKVGARGLPAYADDAADLTVRAFVEMPPEMFPDGQRPSDTSPVATAESGPVAAAPARSMPAAVDATTTADLAAPQTGAAQNTSGAGRALASVADDLPSTRALPLGAALAQRVKLFGLSCPLWLLAALTTLGASVLVALLARGGAEGAVSPEPVASVPAARSAEVKAPVLERSRSVSERAAAGDLDALRELTNVPEQERSVADAVAIAKGNAALAARDVQTFREKLKQDRELAMSDRAKEKLFDYVADPRVAPEALVAISELPSPLGPDLLYEIWTGTKKSNATTRLARELLYKPSVRAGASHALNVALDLRAEPTCAEVSAILPKAEQYGDWRALHLLGRLLLPRGCGKDEQEDCFPCLRDPETKTKVNQAIKAARGRPRPKL